MADARSRRLAYLYEVPRHIRLPQAPGVKLKPPLPVSVELGCNRR